MIKLLSLTLSLCISAVLFAQQQHNLIIDTKNPIAEVSPTMWGVFFEDINFAADGGIYAELVKNRSFEFRNPMQGWRTVGLSMDKGEALVINRQAEVSSNFRFMRINLANKKEPCGIQNEGFRGMGIKAGENYNFYIQAKTADKNMGMQLELIDENKEVIASASYQQFTNEWQEHHVSFKAGKTVEKAQLKVLFTGEGIIDIDMISLFPENTWKMRPKGLRADLVALLDSLHPGFVRFPGGCIVEGYDLENRYQWKKTVGPIEDRTVIKSRWMDEFRHRMAPDYYQSYGVGFYEYFLLSEDLKAQPLPILNCGMACQYNSKEVCQMDEIGPYIQDALDLIEFANGTTTSTWGKLRADMGHPEPFNLKYLGIGNEQWGPQYVERFIEFQKTLKDQHPEIVLIAASGPTPDERSEYLWTELTKLKAEILDEHYYKDPNWFYTNTTRYDSFDRNGPKVFAGEYASHTKGGNAPESRNNWEAALSEAAFMTGLERNADVVVMTAYAPLFAHKEAWQWNPDMIWFDNLQAMPTPNYYVQQIFSLNMGDRVLPITENNLPLSGQNSLYSSVTIDDSKKELLIKLVNSSNEKKAVNLKINGAKINSKSVMSMETLSSDLDTFNEVGGGNNFEKEVSQIALKSKLLTFDLAPLSVNVVKITLSK
ncbi:MAG: alpha-L-arabinofuranosidase C-terminal domain-containing protein [Prolixibacteraceae bacterium]